MMGKLYLTTVCALALCFAATEAQRETRCSSLEDALTTPCTLVSIVNDGIGDDGARALAKLLRSKAGNRIRRLHLPFNKISDEGLEDLAVSYVHARPMQLASCTA